MFNFSGLLAREDELLKKYDQARNKIRIHPIWQSELEQKLLDEQIIIFSAIQEAKKQKDLQDVAKISGASTYTIKRWNSGKNPYYLSTILNLTPNITGILSSENFIFLLGLYQIRSFFKLSSNRFKISNKDPLLWASITKCVKSCFGKRATINNRYSEVNSKGLMEIISHLTEEGNSVPDYLLKTKTKREIYYSGIISNFKVCLETGINKTIKDSKWCHAGLMYSKGNLIEETHLFLDECAVDHNYYASQHKLRLRGKQCKGLVKLLPECSAKEKILRYC